jgi:hypothetical protein
VVTVFLALREYPEKSVAQAVEPMTHSPLLLPCPYYSEVRDQEEPIKGGSKGGGEGRSFRDGREGL